MKKVTFNSLVRDKIPDFLESKGCFVEQTVLLDDVFEKALKSKLIEEADEVRKAASKKELIEEIADLQEVINALLEFHAIDQNEIERAQLKKIEAKGGFERRIFVSEISFEDQNPIALYYQKNSSKYDIKEKS